MYVSLGDSDSIAGAAVLRTADPELSELTLQYECTGMTLVDTHNKQYNLSHFYGYRYDCSMCTSSNS